MKTAKHDYRFGRGLGRLMERHEISRLDLQEWTGVSRQAITQIRRCEVTPNESTKRQLAAAFRLTVAEVEALGDES